MSRRSPFSDGLVPSSAPILKTLRVADGTTRDINALQSGAGLRDVGDLITCTFTRQATVRDGHQEGILNYQPMPAEWRGDGTQSILFIIDQLTIPAASLVVMGGGMLADVGADQVSQVGTLRGIYSTAGPQNRICSVNSTTFTPLGLNLGTLGRVYLRYTPNWSGTVLTDGMIEPWVRNSANVPVALSSGTCEVAVNTMTAPRMCITINPTTTTIAEVTVAARIRYSIQDFLSLDDR